MGLLVVIAIAVILAGPVLAIVALVAVRRLEAEPLHLQIPQLTSRIYTLEKRILALELALRRGASTEGAAEGVKPETSPPPQTLADQV